MRVPCLPCHVFHGFQVEIFNKAVAFPAFHLPCKHQKKQTDCSLDDQSECFVKALIPATKHPSNGSYQGFMNGSSLGFLKIFRGAPAIEVLGCSGKTGLEWCQSRSAQTEPQTQSSCISKCVFALCKATKDAEHAVFTMKLGPFRLTT